MASAGDADNLMQIQGGTDGTTIGNTGTRLHVDSYDAPNATFMLYAEEITIGNDKSMISLLNAGGSSVKVKIREIHIINVRDTLALGGVVAEFRVLRITGHSAGTALTPDSYDTADALNGSVTGRTGATVAGEGTGLLRRVQWSSDEWGVGALDQEGYDHGVQVANPLYFTRPGCKPIILNAGEGITIKQVTNSTNGVFDVTVLFTQEAT